MNDPGPGAVFGSRSWIHARAWSAMTSLHFEVIKWKSYEIYQEFLGDKILALLFSFWFWNSEIPWKTMLFLLDLFSISLSFDTSSFL